MVVIENWPQQQVEAAVAFFYFRQNSVWFNPGWQPQAQLGDGKAPKAV